MSEDIARAKLSSLFRCLQRVKARLPASAELLASDIDAQDIISLNLQRAVQLCVDLAVVTVATKNMRPVSSMGEAFDRLHEAGALTGEVRSSMRSAVGFRNISVHEYRQLDWQIIYGICTERLDDFRKFAQQLVNAGLVGD